MPLPEKDTAWPPKGLAPIHAKFAEWSAWYAADSTALHDVYAGSNHVRDGIVKRAVNAAVRYFWGETQKDLTKPSPRKLHVPVASDICQASSDLLFSEPPTVALDLDPQPLDEDGNVVKAPANVARTAERLAELCGADFHSTLAGGAEVCAALGGAFLRVTWDQDVADHPFLTVMDYDTAVPEFRWGKLVAVTFWQVVRNENGLVRRHLERHETDADNIGVVYHGLYQGTADHLGQILPLADDPATEGLAPLVDEDGKISTQSPGLAVFHWPNMGPNRLWRKHPLGRHLGRSDLDGIEGALDALDEAYTSLIRDVRLGKAMLLVPNQMLENHGPGRGASFTQDEVYSPVNAAPSSMQDSRMNVEQVQFDIRVQEHEQTIALLWNTIVRSAGYSAQTFGESGEVAVTATEVAAKERRSTLTRGRKGRTTRPVLEAAVRKLVDVDAAIFRSGVDTSLPIRVEMGDGFQEDVRTLASTASLLASALAASIETRVRLVNPGKDEPWIRAEVERIKDENRLELADPDTLGIDGAGLSSEFPDPEEGLTDGDAS